MKRYTMSFADSCTHKPVNPERTARKSGTGMSFDVTFQVWPNRASLARSIRMQERREHRTGDWKAVQALETTEGY